jgi:hypothetical protein
LDDESVCEDGFFFFVVPVVGGDVEVEDSD